MRRLARRLGAASLSVASELRDVKGVELAEDDGARADVLPGLFEEGVAIDEELGVRKVVTRLNASSGNRSKLASSSTRRLFKAMEVVEHALRLTTTNCTAGGMCLEQLSPKPAKLSG